MSEPRSPFSLPAYRYWFIGSTLQSLSIGLTLAITLTLVAVTGQPALAGGVLASLTALEILASLVGGPFADSFSRKKIILTCTLLALVAHLTVILLLVTGAGTAGWGTILLILCFGLASLSYGFSDPAFDGSLKSIISQEQFPRAMSAAQIRSSVLSIVGNPLAGFLVSVANFLPFALKFVCESVFFWLIYRIRADLGPGVKTDSGGKRRLWGLVTSYRRALGYIKTQPAITRILLCAPLLNLMVFGASSWAAIDLTARGESGLTVGFVLAGFALGAIVGGFITPAITDRYPAGKVALVGLGLMILFYACYYALAPNPLLMALAAFLCMLPSPPLNAGLFSHVYVVTPRELQGRVHALFTLVGGLGAALAPFFAGLAVAGGGKVLLLVLFLLPACAGYLLLLGSRQVREL